MWHNESLPISASERIEGIAVPEFGYEAFFDRRLVIRGSLISGSGVFSREEIKKGEFVISWTGRLFTIAQARAGQANPHTLAGFDEGVYVGQSMDEPSTPDQFLNHSCDPNLWMVGRTGLVARRSIRPGEEVTADYALWEIDPEWRLQTSCRCGSLACRGEVTGRDWLRPELQEKYREHFLPCINERIRRFSCTSGGSK